MKRIFSGFAAQQLTITIAVYILGFFLFNFFFQPYYFPFLWFLPIIFLGINYLFYSVILKHAEKDIRKFTSRFMAVFGIKIIAMLLFILVYAYSNPEHAVSFLITFFSLYVIYTVFVVVKVLKKLKDSQ